MKKNRSGHGAYPIPDWCPLPDASQSSVEADEENKKLRIAARLIHQRAQVQSGSKEMSDIDEFCKGIGLKVWEWPLSDFWDYENL